MPVKEIDNDEDKNVIANLVHRSPNGSNKILHIYIKLLFDNKEYIKNKKNKQMKYIKNK